MKRINKTAPARKIFSKIGENRGSLGMNTVAATKKRNKTYFAGHASRLADGLQLAATAARMKKSKVDPVTR